MSPQQIRLRPSSAGIWAGAGCTANPHMVAKFGDGALDTTAADEGSAAHWVAENVLKGAPWDQIPEQGPNGVAITDEMRAAVKTYTDYVLALPGDKDIERRISVLDICYGTPDAIVYDAATSTLEVVDYKHGFGVVEPVDNWQLALYAVARIWSTTDPLPFKPERVRLTIHQPRAYSQWGPVRTWEPSIDTLNLMRHTATKRAREVHDNPAAKSGSHCRYCPGRHACPAAIQSGLHLYEAVTSPLPYDMDVNDMSVQYAIISRAREQLEYLQTGYEEQLKAALYSGKKVDGFVLKDKVGSLEWTAPIDEVLLLGQIMGVDLTKPVTPTEALKKGIDRGVINKYTKRDSKGHDLVPVNLTHAKRIFSK